MKAIETTYNGYKFRSRLEARWAVFFDTAGIRYLYEDEGYILQPDINPTPYLPDFYFPDYGAYGEVKGDYSLLDWGLLTDAVEWGNGLPGIYQSDEAKNGKVPVLILLGQIPQVKTSIPIHFMVYHNEGGCLGTVDFNKSVINPDFCGEGLAWEAPKDTDYWQGIFNGDYIRIEGTLSPKVQAAYRKARQARFEHGENG